MRSVKSRTQPAPNTPQRVFGRSRWELPEGAPRRARWQEPSHGVTKPWQPEAVQGLPRLLGFGGPNGGQRSRTGVTSLGQVGWPVESRAGCFCLALHTPGRGPRGWPPTGHSRQRRGRRLSLPRLPHHLSELGPAVTPRCSEDGTCSFHPGGRESPVGSVTLQQEKDPGPVWGHLWSSPPGGGLLAWGGGVPLYPARVAASSLPVVQTRRQAERGARHHPTRALGPRDTSGRLSPPQAWPCATSRHLQNRRPAVLC